MLGFLESPKEKKMPVAIDNLNKVQETRQWLICQILYREGNGKSNRQYEDLEQRLNKASFKTLDNKATKYMGNWRLQLSTN